MTSQGWLFDIAGDLRYALRAILRRRTGTIAALLTLALGIGASTAVYSVLDALILNQLSYRDAKRVFLVWGSRTQGAATFRITPTSQLVERWQVARTIEGFARFRTTRVSIASEGEQIDMEAARIDPGFIRFAGVPMLLGRGFDIETPSEHPEVVVLSEGVWRARYGSADTIVGQTIRLNDTAYTIIGVASRHLQLPAASQASTQLWLPLHDGPEPQAAFTLARLRHKVGMQAAERELDALANDAEGGGGGKGAWETQLERPRDAIATLGRVSILLAGAVGVLLIIGCVNVAHLLLADAAAREHELATRMALGAPRWRITQMVLLQSMILAVVGGVLGVGVAVAGLRGLLALRPVTLAALDRAEISGGILLAGAGIMTLCGVAAGLVASMRAGRIGPRRSLMGTASRVTLGRAEIRMRALFVVTQVALSALLLVGAAVVLRSVQNLQRVDMGFDARNLYELRVRLPTSRYEAPASRTEAVTMLIARIRAIPGVETATASSAVPPIASVLAVPLETETRAGIQRSDGPVFMPTLTVRADFFQVMKIQFIEGSTFAPNAEEHNAVIINETLARRLWLDESAVGRRVRLAGGPGAPWNTVVGVTRNIMTRELGSVGDEGLMYFPTSGGRLVVFRTTSEEKGIHRAIRAAVREFDPLLTTIAITAVADRVAETMALPRFVMMLLGLFAGCAVGLAGVGLYGVVAYTVVARMRDIAVRMALGAGYLDVALAVVRTALVPSVVGVVLGLTGAVWGTRLLRAVLFGVSETDALSYGVSAAIVIAIAVTACVPPMRRAMTLNLTRTLKGDA